MHIYYPAESAWPNEAGAIVLERTEWNDWYRWRTLFYAYYLSPTDGSRIPVGALKVADLATEYERNLENGTITELPPFFDRRPGELLSVGQDESYYSNLRTLLGVTKMRETLRLLGDLALETKLLRANRNKPVVRESLLRSVPTTTVEGAYRRIIQTGRSKVEFEFSYFKQSTNPLVTQAMKMEFAVVPDSKPPTNIHVLIGRNGAGKTTVMRSMAKALVDPKTTREADGWFEAGANETLGVANVVYVAFSAFDEAVVPVTDISGANRSYSYVGLQYIGSKKLDHEEAAVREIGDADPSRARTRTVDELGIVFAQSAWIVATMKSLDLWVKALTDLESDRNFQDAKVSKLASMVREGASENTFKAEAKRLYRLLSSGHKIVLLTITRLVETVTDKTLVLLDEPEGHLHPPLLSAFVRALSELLRARNGVAIVSTHSPVIVQEVPVSCVYKLVRDGKTQSAERLSGETFGENAGTLTSTVFGLEVEESGFHRMIAEAASRLGNYEAVTEEFNYELGFEARAALRALLANRDR